MMLKERIKIKAKMASPSLRKGSFFFLVLLAAYIQFLNPYITCDHIGMALFKTKASVGLEEILSFASGGRFGNILIQFFYFILGKLHVSHYENMWVIQLLGILLFAVSCVILHDLFSGFFEEEKQKKLLDGIILVCFINPFMVETYLYGSFDWAFGILLSVLAAKWIYQKKYIPGFIMAFLAVSIYQTNIMITAIVAFLACFLKNLHLPKRKFYIESLIVFLLCGGAALLNIFIFHLFAAAGNDLNPAKTPQVANNYFALFIKILDQMKSTYISMFSTYPRRFLPLFVIAVCGVTVVSLLWKKKYYQSIVYLAVVGVLFLLPFAYMLAANSVWCVQRTLLPVFFAMSMFLLGTLFLIKKHHSLYKAFVAACILFFGVTLYYTETLITDCYIGQALDYNEVICIEDEIREYEEETGIVVDTISWKKSADAEYVHPLLRLQDGNICSHRIIYDAGDYLLKLVSQKDYTLLWMTEDEYERYFGEEEWKVFNPSKQLHFEDNILYWAVY